MNGRRDAISRGYEADKLREVVLLDHEVRLRFADGTPDRTVTQPKVAALLVRLALARDMRVSSTELLQAQRTPSKDALERAFSDLREYGVPVPHRGRGPLYVLELSRNQVDALHFVDGVGALADTAPAEDIDPLLAMWRADPRDLHQGVPPGLWRPVSDALDRLVCAVEELRERTRELRHLLAFAQVFPTDGRLTAIGGPPVRKRRLLIVEDQIGDVFVDHLGDFDCVLVQSLKYFWGLVAAGPLEFDCALVDQHLNDRMNDYGGKTVCEYLRDNTTIPTIYMSVSKLPERGSHQQLVRTLRLWGLYAKADDQTLDGLRDMISEAIGQR
jgi:hypothetical protein